MSSHSAPTLQELQQNPLGALTKGWGLFSSAVTSASREIQESVVKPGMSRAQELANGQGGGNEEWRRYLAGLGMNAKEASNWLSQRGGEGLERLNDVAKSRGVDLDEQLAKLGISNQRAGAGYGHVGAAQLDRAEGGDITPHGGRDDDFFDSWDEQPTSKPAQTASTGSTAAQTKGQAAAKKKDDWNDDEWKDF